MAEKILSVFIDESGDFGPYDYHAPFYLVALVFHEQSNDISKNIQEFEAHVSRWGYPHHAVHTGPLIRRESVYENDSIESRLHLFNALSNFARKLTFQYACAEVKKVECADQIAMSQRLSRSLSNILITNKDYFSFFDRIVLYYDNGQQELTKILTAVFTALFSQTEFRKVQPADYKLFQVADLVCTMELLERKAEANTLTSSELNFFSSRKDLKKNYIKPLKKKHI